MFWLVAVGVTLTGASIHSLMSGVTNWSAHEIAAIFLFWCLAGFMGVATLISGFQHIFNSDRMAEYIGWEKGSGFQLELGWAEVGIAIAACLTPFLGGTYAIAPTISGSVFFFAAAVVHARDMVKTGNFSAGNAGPVFYVDIGMPVVTTLACLIYFFT